MKRAFKKVLSISPLGIYETIRDRRNDKLINKRNKALLSDYFSNNNVRKIQIGAGSNLLPGWLNTDLNSTQNIAFLDAGKPFPFKNESVDFIFSEHLFEHLDLEQQINMCKESFRVLKNGGICRIATPSLKFLNNLYNSPESTENKEYINWAVNSIPGLSSVKMNVEDETTYKNYVINHFFKAWGHQMIHDFDSLKSLMLSIGFSQVEEREVGESDHADLKCLEKHGQIIPPEMNLLETMIIEVKK